MVDNKRNRRRGLLEVLEFARASESGVTNIESKKKIISAITLDFQKDVRNAIRNLMMKNGDYVELISGDYFVYDVTDKSPKQRCRVGDCKKRARILETRLVFVYDDKNQEYQLGEFSPEVMGILQSTRKRAVICDNDMFESYLKGTTLDIYEPIPQVTKLAQVSKLKTRKPAIESNVLTTDFKRKRSTTIKAAERAEVIQLFEKSGSDEEE